MRTIDYTMHNSPACSVMSSKQIVCKFHERNSSAQPLNDSEDKIFFHTVQIKAYFHGKLYREHMPCFYTSLNSVKFSAKCVHRSKFREEIFLLHCQSRHEVMESTGGFTESKINCLQHEVKRRSILNHVNFFLIIILSVKTRPYYLHAGRKFRTAAAQATILPLVLFLTHNRRSCQESVPNGTKYNCAYIFHLFPQ